MEQSYTNTFLIQHDVDCISSDFLITSNRNLLWLPERKKQLLNGNGIGHVIEGKVQQTDF